MNPRQEVVTIRSRLTLIAAVTVTMLSSIPAIAAVPPDQGPRLPALDQTVNTLLDHSSVSPADLDGDGSDELIVLSRDGIAQRYDPDGTFIWSASTIEIAPHAEAEAVDGTSSFEGDYRGRTTCTTDHGVAFADRNGDGVRDVIATSWVQLAEPAIEQRSLVVELDGATGRVLATHRFEGWVTNLVGTDLDGDGPDDLLLTEEDGPIEQLTSADGRVLSRGTGGTTRIRAYDLEEREVLWTHDSGRGWGQINAMTLASGPDGPGLAVALTGPTPKPVCGPEDPGGPSGQDLLMLDATTGQPRWSVTSPSFIHEVVPADPDGDGRDHLVVATRSGAASSVRGVDAGTGATTWTAGLAQGSRVWDVAVSGDAVTAAVSVPPAVAVAEDVARLVILDAATGTTRQDVELDGGVTPAAASAAPSATLMRLAVAALDPLPPREVVVRTDRILAAVGMDGRIRWQTEPLGGRNVLTVSRLGGAEHVWIQGPYDDPLVEDPDYLLDGVERGRYRLHSVNPATGALDRTIPLMAAVLGLARVDVNQDGVPDRVMGGLSQAVFAMDGADGRILWTKPMDHPVLDVYPEDVDRDGSPDVIVESHLEVHALDAVTGATVWAYRHQPSLGAGRWAGFELTDMTGDGVRDVALGTSSGSDGGMNAVESAHVLVLNGATGTVVWQRLLPPPLKRVNGLAVGDATGDGIPDVGVAFEALGAPWLYSAWMFDGATGIPLWRVDEREHPGGRAAPMNAARMADAGGDGDADLAVLTAGNGQMDPAVRMHDGRTGAELWLRETGTPEGQVDVSGFGLHLGRIDPGQPPILLATAKEDLGGSTISYVHGFTTSGQTAIFQHVPNPLVWDLETGDVTGDGVGDVVVPWIRGFGVLDGARALAGEPAIFGHMEERFPTKTALFDIDGDGVMEVETFVTPGTWPIGIGQNLLIDVTVPSKAVGVLDLSP